MGLLSTRDRCSELHGLLPHDLPSHRVRAACGRRHISPPPLGRFATIEEAEAAARTAVDGFASFARISSPDGMWRLLVRNEYRGEPIPPNAIQRVGMGREDAANDEADSVNN